MRSGTSFFNRTIFTKSMGRFWPVWGTYFAVWLLVLPVPLLSEIRYYDAQTVAIKDYILRRSVEGGIALSVIFAGLMAMAVWSFLYNTRSAYGTASLPLRRENLFFSNIAAGFLPLLGANLVIAVLTGLAGFAAADAAAFGAAFQWFAIVSLMLLFFYGFATLCAQLTGNIVIMPLVYAVLNFTAFGVELLLRVIFSRFVYGFSESVSSFGAYVTRWLSPVLGYMDALVSEPIVADRSDGIGQIVVDYRFHGWGVLLIYAAVGVVMLAGALLLLRRRNMETAGDVVAVKALKPVFRWCMALGCALALACLVYAISPVFDNTGAFFEMLIFMIIGAFIGWFAAQMLITKSFRVFRRGWSGWTGLEVCWLVILVLMLGMRFDLFGFERYVPAADTVESVEFIANGERVILSGQENIERVTALHESIIEHKEDHTKVAHVSEGTGWTYCRIIYQLNSGETVLRFYSLSYDINAPAGDVVAAQEILNTPEAIAWRKQTDIPFTRDTVYHGIVEVDYDYDAIHYVPGSTDDPSAVPEPIEVGLTAEEAWELYSTCILPDFEDGTLGNIWIIEGTGYETTAYAVSVYIEAMVEEPDGSFGHDMIRTKPTVDSLRTNAWLEAHGITLRLVGEA